MSLADRPAAGQSSHRFHRCVMLQFECAEPDVRIGLSQNFTDQS